MAANGGDIVVQLRMDDGQFRVAVVEAGDLVRALKGKIDQTSSSIQKMEQHSDSMGRRFRDLVLTLGNLRFIAMDINDVFLQLPSAILKTSGELEKMQQLMTGLSKETDLAKRKLEGMQDMNFVIGMAKNAPFDIQALSSAFVKLKTAGIDPSNGSMQALVDSVARFGGSSDMLNRAAIAIQQMSGKGVISMEELRQQLGEAVPTAMKSMADGMEMTMAELAKAVSTGTMAAGPALKKMFMRMQVDNAGAAAEMMNTWVGMTSQLKTEWGLTARDIANAGFMDASKTAVTEIIALLRSPEFREFGVSFGQGLAEAVRGITSIAEALIKYREEIALVAQGWLAYKVIASGIAPLSETIKKTYESKVAQMRVYSATLANVGASERAAAVEAARNAAIEANASKMLLVTKQEAMQAELVAVRQKNAAILAESSRLSAQLIALQNAERKYNANNIGEQQRKLHQIEQLATASRNLSARQLELGREVASTTAALNAASAAAAAKTTNANALATSMRSASMATRAATVASSAFSSVVGFLGGPIGVLITAIGGLIMWWNSLTDAANRARQAQQDALVGQTTADQMKDLEKAAEKAAKKLAIAKTEAKETQRLAGMGVSPVPVLMPKTAAEIASDKAAVEAAAAEDTKAREALERGRENILRAGADRRAQTRMLDLGRELTDMENATRQKIAQITQERDAFEKANLDKDGKLNKSAQQRYHQYNAEQNKLLESGMKERIARAKGLATELRAAAGVAGLSKEELAARSAEAAAAEDKVAELQNRYNALEATIGAKPSAGMEKKDKRAKGPSPFESLIAGLREDRERLEAEIKGLEATPGKVDKVAGAIAEMTEKLKSKKFSGIKPAEKKEAIDEAAAKAKLEVQKDEMEKVAKDYQRVSDFIEGMRPDIEAAMELLADPLGTSTRGALQKRAENFIGKNLVEIENYAKKMGIAVQSVKNEIVNEGTKADTANVFAKMIQETASMNAAMVEDTRNAARAKAEADNQRHRQVVQNLLIERIKAGASEEEIIAMQEAINANVLARGNKLGQDFKGPMDTLVSNWKNASKNMEEASVGWANKTMDAMTEMAMTGKMDFRSLANSIISDIIRINMQKAAAGAISSATSWLSSMALFANGGIMTEMGSMPLKKYAKGGIANSPQLAMFGEGSMPEAYVPLPDGRSIPVTMNGNGGGGSVQINITVNNDGSSNTSTSGEEASAYRTMGERIRGVIQEEMMKQTRPGGMLYR